MEELNKEQLERAVHTLLHTMKRSLQIMEATNVGIDLLKDAVITYRSARQTYFDTLGIIKVFDRKEVLSKESK